MMTFPFAIRAFAFGFFLTVGVSGLVPPATAQVINPGAAPSAPLPPPPPPPPPPKVEVPPVPKLDSPSPRPEPKLQQRSSFGDRVLVCLDEAAAMGVGATDRAAYSRACATR